MSKVYAVLYCIIWPFFHFLHPFCVVGRENIPQGGALICANHLKMSDPLYVVFAAGLKNRMQVMAKEELMQMPALGWLLKKAGIFGVKRGKADIVAVKRALKVLKSDEKLLIFPEGTRVKDGETSEAKTGAAMMALRTGVPVVPIYLPRTNRGLFHRITVVIGEPYVPQTSGKRATPEEYHRVADEIMEHIFELEEKAV